MLPLDQDRTVISAVFRFCVFRKAHVGGDSKDKENEIRGLAWAWALTQRRPFIAVQVAAVGRRRTEGHVAEARARYGPSTAPFDIKVRGLELPPLLRPSRVVARPHLGKVREHALYDNTGRRKGVCCPCDPASPIRAARLRRSPWPDETRAGSPSRGG